MTTVLAQNVSKSYPLYATPAQRLRDALHPINELDRYYALQDISFELEQGDTLGVLGINGAGKSTLLKILAGVVTPTEGSVKVHGRCNALLELGAAFHSEYSGIENARMSLALMGLSDLEVDEELPKVLAFADIGEFSKYPVKTYSSGMFVRLAFACATCVRPDVLLVDEALSVGDLFFQSKSMLRMKQMLTEGTTLVFVSHDIGAVKSICNKCLLLNGGKLFSLGQTQQVAREYFNLQVMETQPQPQPLARASGEFAQELTPTLQARQELAQEAACLAFEKRASIGRLGDGRIRFLDVMLLDEQGEVLQNAFFGQQAQLVMRLKVNLDVDNVCVGYHIQAASGVDVIYSDTEIEACNPIGWKEGEIHSVYWKFTLNLAEGSHNIAVVCSEPIDMTCSKVEYMDYVHTAVQFSMQRRKSAKIYSLAYWKNEVTYDEHPHH